MIHFNWKSFFSSSEFSLWSIASNCYSFKSSVQYLPEGVGEVWAASRGCRPLFRDLGERATSYDFYLYLCTWAVILLLSKITNLYQHFFLCTRPVEFYTFFLKLLFSIQDSWYLLAKALVLFLLLRLISSRCMWTTVRTSPTPLSSSWNMLDLTLM